MKNTKPQTERGFTLVETLVAITILLIVIVGPMKISSQAAKSSSFSNEQVTAFFLAQEGLEIAQKARDDMILKYFITPTSDPQHIDDPWDKITNASSPYKKCFDDGCGLWLDTDSVGSVKVTNECTVSQIQRCKLYLNNSSGKRARYTHVATGNSTPYTRVIKFVEIDDSIKVVSTVTWRTGTLRQIQKVTDETYLFNIYGLPLP